MRTFETGKGTLRWRYAARGACLTAVAALMVGTAQAGAPIKADAQTIQDLLKRVEALEAQVKANAQAQQDAQQAQQEVQQQRQEVEALKQELQTTQTKIASTTPVPPEGDHEINFHLSGTVAANYMASDMKGAHSNFMGGSFMPVFLASYSDWLLLEAHMEFMNTPDGGTDSSLEYAQLDFLVNDYMTVVAGKFLSPLGQFQQAIHPPWVNKLPDRPVGFEEDGGDEPLSDVGLMVRGGVPIGNMKGTYAFYVSNGPSLEDAGPALEGKPGDNNGNKAIGGRVSLFVLPHLEFGISGMTTKIKGNEAGDGTETQSSYHMYGADFAYTKGSWDVRGEYIHAHLNSLMSALADGDPTATAIPATTWNNWYLQAAYRLAGLTDNPIVSKFEPVVRYSQLKVHGFDDYGEGQEKRWTAGLNYWFAPSAVAKIAYEHKKFPMMGNVNVFRTQVAFGF